MHLPKTPIKIMPNLKNWFYEVSTTTKITVIIVTCIVAGLGIKKAVTSSKNTETTYETAIAEKGALINSISGSGTISSGNNTSITTKVSGVVSKVYVTNGDKVVKGQKIADVALDDYAKERQTTAWANYLNAQEEVKTAQKNKLQADLQMWQDSQSIVDAEKNIDLKNENNINPATKEEYTEQEKVIIDKKLEVARAAFAESELKYKNSDSEISSAQAKVVSALRDFQENSASIIAPASGIIRDLSLAQGITIAATTSTSNTSGATLVSSQSIGKISDPDGQLIASVNLSEIDIVGVKAKQKVIITIDAYENMNFTGTVLSVDTSGTSTQNVTSYPVKILLDPVDTEIYQNMAINVQIITNIKNDVILIPTSAITTMGDRSTVRVNKNGNITEVEVKIGSSNDSQTEVMSGLSTDDEVITAEISQSDNKTNNNTTSPFSGFGGSNSRSNSNNNRGFTGSGFTGGGGPPMGF